MFRRLMNVCGKYQVGLRIWVSSPGSGCTVRLGKHLGLCVHYLTGFSDSFFLAGHIRCGYASSLIPAHSDCIDCFHQALLIMTSFTLFAASVSVGSHDTLCSSLASSHQSHVWHVALSTQKTSLPRPPPILFRLQSKLWLWYCIIFWSHINNLSSLSRFGSLDYFFYFDPCLVCSHHGEMPKCSPPIEL